MPQFRFAKPERFDLVLEGAPPQAVGERTALTTSILHSLFSLISYLIPHAQSSPQKGAFYMTYNYPGLLFYHSCSDFTADFARGRATPTKNSATINLSL